MSTKKVFKVKIKNDMYYGLSHGLKFTSGVSEAFEDEELYNRLLAKGYDDVDIEAEEKAKKEAAAKENEKVEKEIQKRIDAAVAKALEDKKSK